MKKMLELNIQKYRHFTFRAKQKTKNFLSKNHFLAEDFKEERSDKNNSRRTGKGTNLQRKELKPNDVPSLWPDCSKLLSKIPPQERPTCTSTSTARYELEKFQDTFVSLDDLEVKLDMATLPNSITKSRCPSSIMFFSVSYEGKPEIYYCLKLNNDLQFELWCNSKFQKSENHSDEEISACTSLRSCKLLLKMLNYLQDEFNNRSTGVCTDKEKMNDIVDMIKVEHLDDNKKIAFLYE